MTTALALARPQQADLALRQAAWDLFFEDELAKTSNPNPELRRDIALDRTLRALGRRPRNPLTQQEREDLMVQLEVEQIIAESSARHNYGRNCWGRE